MYSWDAEDGLVRILGHGEFGGAARPVICSSKEPSADCAQRLSELLQHWGANTAANHCFRQTDAAVARAAETIAGWLAYLPVACVRTMVNRWLALVHLEA